MKTGGEVHGAAGLGLQSQEGSGEGTRTGKRRPRRRGGGRGIEAEMGGRGEIEVLCRENEAPLPETDLQAG